MAIAVDKRRRLIAELPRGVRGSLLRRLEGPAPAGGEVWAAALDRFATGTCDALGGSPLPLADDRVEALADRLRAEAPDAATWLTLWPWP